MSNPRVIPRAQLSAWEKWELASLNESAAEVRAAAAAEEGEGQPYMDELDALEAVYDLTAEPYSELLNESVEVAAEDVSIPTAEEIEAIGQQAQKEGFEVGLETGRLVAEDEANRLHAVLASVESLLKKAEATLANEVLDLAVVIARQMVRDELNQAPERLLPVIREALVSLPVARSPSRVFLHPEDLSAISGMLGGEMPSDTWRFLPDIQLEAGGCRIETPDSMVDLSLAVRWKNILCVLGRNERPDLAWGEANNIALPTAATIDEASSEFTDADALSLEVPSELKDHE
jgi:flagellar assembly protein FliH